MASTTTTTPSKRNLLKGWGSRRRPRPLAPHPETPRTRHAAEPDSIDRMASALLDDAFEDRAEGGDDSGHNRGATSSCASKPLFKGSGLPQAADETFKSPFPTYPTVTRARGEDPNIGLLQAQPVQSRTSGSTRLKPKSKRLTFAPPEHQPSPGTRCATRSSPLLLGATPEAPDPNAGKGTAFTYMASAEEIHDKVKAMLAATEALKPTSPQSRSSSSPKTPQAVHSRVFSKVTNVWERINLRPSTPRERVRSKLHKSPVQNRAIGPLVPETTPLSTDMQGTAQSSQPPQAQTVVQGKEQALRDHATLFQAEQLKERPSPQSLGCFGRKEAPTARAARDDEPGVPSYHLQDPFKTEAGFELNLESRILSTAPIGFSTPRSRSKAGSTASSAEDSANALSEAQVRLARVICNLGKDGAARGQARQVMLKPSESRRTVAEAGHGEQQMIRPVSRISQIRGSERVKKHPSPSKRDLEALELALQENDTVALRPPLLVKDGNRLARNRTSSMHTKPLAIPQPRRKHRVPKSSRGQPKLRPGARLTTPFRPPTVTGSNDCDELH